jgi:hypothetical protein
MIAIHISLLPTLLLAQESDPASISALITQLGNPSYVVREKATQALLRRPDAEAALRVALRSPDLEVRRRAATVLHHHALRELHAAVKQGKVERVIDLLTHWSAGKHEQEAWEAVRDLTFTLIDLHEKDGGKAIPLKMYRWESPPIVVSAKRITEGAKIQRTPGTSPELFLRAGEVDVDYSRHIGTPPSNETIHQLDRLVVVSAGGVVLSAEDVGQVVFAGGNVTVSGSHVHMVLVSGGDVTFTKEGILAGSLVIARGKVTCPSRMSHCRIISGRSVDYDPERTFYATIKENEPNPLGFIRWSESAKSKRTTKAK